MKYKLENKCFMGHEKIPYFSQIFGKNIENKQNIKIKHSNEINMKSKWINVVYNCSNK